MLNIGSHLRVFFGDGWHHGVYSGRKHVIHLSAPERWNSLQRKLTSHVHVATLEQFCGESHTFQRILELHLPDRVLRFPRGPNPQAVDRAREKLNVGGYKLFSNNCEHFAYYCTTGKPMSTQVQPFKEVASCSGGCAGMFRAPFLMVGKLLQHTLHKRGESDAAQQVDPADYCYPVLVEEYTLPVITRGRIMRLP